RRPHEPRPPHGASSRRPGVRLQHDHPRPLAQPHHQPARVTMYREPPPGMPLLLCSDRQIQAFDSATGALLWEKSLWEGPFAGANTRIASAGDFAVVGAGTHATILDVT